MNCKKDLKCLKCMDTCYNKHGSPFKKSNIMRDKAIACEKVCWETEFNLVPQIDFGISDK